MVFAAGAGHPCEASGAERFLRAEGASSYVANAGLRHVRRYPAAAMYCAAPTVPLYREQLL